jgi:hypothetical protein
MLLDAGSWHEEIRHNLLFPSIQKGAETERGRNGKRHKGKRPKGKRHNQVFAKPERGMHKRKEAERNLAELSICLTRKGHKRKEAELFGRIEYLPNRKMA